MKNKKFDYYTWQKFEKDCKKIAAWARRKGFKNIYGIPRGGLVVAIKLSHLLDIPLVLNKEDVMRKTLIVDDVVDAGKTIERLILAIGNKRSVASLYFADGAKMKPDFFVRCKKKWIIFPWETTATSKYDNTI